MSKELNEWKNKLTFLFDEVAGLPEEEQSKAMLYASNVFAETLPRELLTAEEIEDLQESFRANEGCKISALG